MKLREMPRDLFLLTMTMIIANIAGFMTVPLMPLYLKTLGASTQQIGIFFTLQVMLSICFRILGGWVSDNIGRLPAIALGGTVGFFGYSSFAAAPTWEWAILAASFAEISRSLVAPSFQAYTAEKAPKGGESSTFGIVNALFLICMIIGPLLGGFLAEIYSYKTMFWIATGIYGIATLMRINMAWGAKFELKTLHPASLGRELRGLLGLFFAGGLLWWLFIADGLVDAGTQLALPFLPTFVTDIGKVSDSTYGVLFALMSLVGAAANLPAGRFADAYGERVSIAVGVCLFSVAWGLIISLPGISAFIIGFGMAGIAQAFIGPAFSALISKAVPKSSLGIMWGIFLTALGVLAIPAPAVGGWLYDNVRPESTFVLAAIMMLWAAPLALWKLRLPVATKTETEAVQSVMVSEGQV